MSDRRYYGKIITTAGKEALDRQIEEWKAKLAESLRVNGNREARDCGNGSNGLSGTDSVTADHENMRRIITDLTVLRSQATILPRPSCRKELGVDMIATLMYHQSPGEGKPGEKKRVQIHVVGYNEGDCDTLPRKISYEAPLVQPFLGQESGTQAHVQLDGHVRMVTLTGIHLYRPRRKKVAVKK